MLMRWPDAGPAPRTRSSARAGSRRRMPPTGVPPNGARGRGQRSMTRSPSSSTRSGVIRVTGPPMPSRGHHLARVVAHGGPDAAQALVVLLVVNRVAAATDQFEVGLELDGVGESCGACRPPGPLGDDHLHPLAGQIGQEDLAQVGRVGRGSRGRSPMAPVGRAGPRRARCRSPPPSRTARWPVSPVSCTNPSRNGSASSQRFICCITRRTELEHVQSQAVAAGARVALDQAGGIQVGP